MYYSYNEAGVPEIIRFWDCDHVFVQRSFSVAAAKGEFFGWISTVSDRNLSLVNL